MATIFSQLLKCGIEVDGADVDINPDGNVKIRGTTCLTSAAAVTALNNAVAAGTPAARKYSIPLTSVVKDSARKDALEDTPGTSLLGLADAQASAIVGTTTNGGGTATATENGAFQFVLPPEYVSGGTITLRIRAKVSAARTVSATVDAVVKLVGDATVGSDICATSPIALTTTIGNKDFTITPTGLVAGDILDCVITLATNDTGGTSNGFPSITAISVLATTAM